MATEKKTLNIECKLNKENYQLWEFQMVALLEDEKLLETVSNDDLGDQSPYQVKNNARAKRAILTNCTEAILISLVIIKSAPEMWQYLYNSFSGINMARKYAGIKKLATLTYGIGSMEENLLLVLKFAIVLMLVIQNDVGLVIRQNIPARISALTVNN